MNRIEVGSSHHDVFDYRPGHIGQPEIAAGVAERELGVIEAEQVENSGVEIVDVDGVFDGLVAVVVADAIGHAASDTAAGHPA